jgi:hypothetical protein
MRWSIRQVQPAALGGQCPAAHVVQPWWPRVPGDARQRRPREGRNAAQEETMGRTSAIVAIVVALGAIPASLAAQTPAAADPGDANLTAYIELLRTDVRAQKIAFHTQLLQLTDTEDLVFWPIYRQYDVELSKLNDERIAMIREYAAKADAVSEELADSLARRALDIDRRRNALLERYYDRVKTALSARTAARFLQVEHQLLLLIDLQIAAALPVVR